MKSDLSSINNDVEIVSAVLKVYKHKNFSDYSKASTYTVHEISEQWSESTVNWTAGWSATGGAFSSTAVSSFAYNGSFNGWFEFDVTTSVKKFVQNPNQNFGFMLDAPGGDDIGGASMDQESYFHSSESDKTDLRPHIVITYKNTAIVSPDKAHQSIPFSMSNGVLHLQDGAYAKVQLFTLKGQLLQSIQLDGSISNIDLRTIAKGCLILQLSNSKQTVSKVITIK